MKPWGRLEIGWIDHPKFMALTANAICLWLEGKNYCEKHHTDGLIPQEALKTFRFDGKKSVRLLLTARATKGDGTAYAPFWERHDVGFKMHDYLEYNECRDAVLARLADADVATQDRRDRDKEYKRHGRAAKKAKKAAASVGQSVGQIIGQSVGQSADSRPDVRTTSPSITDTDTETDPEKEREREKSASLSPPADPFVNPAITERAGAFVRRYEQLYPKHRKGARYAVKPMRDYAAAVTLCQTWPDDRLEKLAVIFLTTDHKFAEEGSRTIPQFLGLASWCDGKLAEHETKKAGVA